ncbi:unnamed protein product [Didymodactylos carnosus]|uniref:Uncharacterized protein n=1 Tax=Didymodactylos carnosus TaxID=1234261 RepID=A0A815SH44_9BILA|nr:unnamed protein product [Didymodactylos carnosus]CAF4353245.1 unnamed protein product [Didymodactylos carnosus]
MIISSKCSKVTSSEHRAKILDTIKIAKQISTIKTKTDELKKPIEMKLYPPIMKNMEININFVNNPSLDIDTANKLQSKYEKTLAHSKIEILKLIITKTEHEIDKLNEQIIEEEQIKNNKKKYHRNMNPSSKL